jgi:hypothetical protein
MGISPLPVAQVDGAASLLGDAAVTRRRQLLGILGRARHVLRIQAVHGAHPPRLGTMRPALFRKECHSWRRAMSEKSWEEEDEGGGKDSYHTAGEPPEGQA